MYTNTLALALLAGAVALVPLNPPADPVAQIDEPVGQMIFFAVLEGLYSDGVSTEAVDLILATDPKTKQPRFEEHFVYACPLCHPAFDALLLYRGRKAFYGLKASPDTFGPGLDERMLNGLKSKNKVERLATIQALIESWLRRRLDSKRLTSDERAAWTARIEEGRKKGMLLLSQAQVQVGSPHAGRLNCPICDGSAAACKLKR